MSSNPQRFHIKIRQPQQKIRFESHLVASMLESLVMSHLSQQLGATDPWLEGEESHATGTYDHQVQSSRDDRPTSSKLVRADIAVSAKSEISWNIFKKTSNNDILVFVYICYIFTLNGDIYIYIDMYPDSE